MSSLLWMVSIAPTLTLAAFLAHAEPGHSFPPQKGAKRPQTAQKCTLERLSRLSGEALFKEPVDCLLALTPQEWKKLPHPVALELMGHSRHKVRELATQALLIQGESVKDYLKTQKNHSDPEICRRVEFLLTRLRTEKDELEITPGGRLDGLWRVDGTNVGGHSWLWVEWSQKHQKYVAHYIPGPKDDRGYVPEGSAIQMFWEWGGKVEGKSTLRIQPIFINDIGGWAPARPIPVPLSAIQGPSLQADSDFDGLGKVKLTRTSFRKPAWDPPLRGDES